MFEVPQRQQLKSIHRLLNVPPVATVKLGNAYQFEKFGTGNSLLRYGIRIRCSKRLPGVRDAFSEAFGVKNRLFWYGRDIRYRKRPSLVRDAFSGAPGTQQPPPAPSGAQKSGWQLPLRGLSTPPGRGKGPQATSSALAGRRKWRKGPERTK